MKTGKTLLELATEIERQAQTKVDYKASTKMLEIVDTEHVQVGSKGNFNLTETAHDQLGTYTDIPASYYDKMRKEAPELYKTSLNHWLKAKEDVRLIRTLDGNARAFLSDKYRMLDNYDLLQCALPVLLKDSSLRIESCEVTEKKLYLKAVTEKITYSTVGDTVQAGIVLSNSEIGQGRLTIEPLLWRKVCANGMISLDSTLRKNHIGRGNKEFEGAEEFFRDATREADDRAFWMKVTDTLNSVFTQINFEKIAQKFFASKEEPITKDPVEVVEVVAKKYLLNQQEKTGVLTSLLRNGDMNKFGLINAITEHSQDVNSYDRATELEKLGGEILELPRSSWTSLAIAMQ